MSTTNTTNISLVKPTVGTKEPWDQSLVNGNWDKIDAAFGETPSKFTTTTVSNTTTETSLFLWTISGGTQGSAYRMRIWGTFDHASSATATLRAKIGGTTFATQALAAPASVLTNRTWDVTAEIVISVTGASGKWRGSMFGLWLNNTTVTPYQQIPTAETTKDTTVGQGLEVSVQWTAASASSVFRADAGYAGRVTNL